MKFKVKNGRFTKYDKEIRNDRELHFFGVFKSIPLIDKEVFNKVKQFNIMTHLEIKRTFEDYQEAVV